MTSAFFGLNYKELALAQEAIRSNIGVSPLFRAAYDVRPFGLRQAQKRLDLMGVIWTVIGHDWHWPAPRISRFQVQRAASISRL